jgi:hypothetical protein
MAKHAMSLFSVDVINPDMTGRLAHARISERIRTAIASGALVQNARMARLRAVGLSLATPVRRAMKRKNA